MSFSKLSILFKSLPILLFGPILMVLLSNSANGQLFKSSSISNIDQSGFFVIATREGTGSPGLLGLMGLSDSSAQTTPYHFGMRDENG